MSNHRIRRILLLLSAVLVALLVRPGDAAGLAAALQALLDDAALADTFRLAGPRRAAGATWRRSAERHLDAYRLAMSGTATTPASPTTPATAGTAAQGTRTAG